MRSSWAAFFNFVAFMFFGLHVAETVGRGIVEADVVNSHVIFGALAGAIVWQIVTQRLGIPSSSSHALIGGLVGAGLAKAGVHAVVWSGVGKTVAAIFLSPGLGLLLALAAHADGVVDFRALGAVWRRQYFPPHSIRVGIAVTRSAMAATMRRRRWGSSPFCFIRRASSARKFYIPFWVVLACQIAMAAGTMAGGWRIVKTMGSKITRLTPMQGSCAETAGSVMLFAAT